MDPRMRKRPSQGRSRVTVTSILEAADRILRTDGYDAASTNRVARVAGFSVGSLYQYFRDKQAIVGALIDRELAAEAEDLRQLLEQHIASPAREIANAAFGQLIARRASRAYLHRTLDVHALELGAKSILDHFVASQAPVLSDTMQRIGARAFSRSPRSVDARVFVVSRLAASVSFTLVVDAPPGSSPAALREEFAAAVERYLDGGPPGPNATALVLGWAKPAGAPLMFAEQRGRRRREARAVLLAAGAEADRLETLALLLAGLAEVVSATARPPHGASQDQLLHEISRFAAALGI
jgi:AcrR family transcriptional regulator